MAVKELHTKASRAWFSISKIIFQNKRLPISQALKLFDSLVSPISLYSCEFWTPLNLPESCFSDQDSLIRSWETFLPELHNQRLCRMVLSVHKKTSRLAILGELSRYPVILRAFSQCLKYEWSLSRNSTPNSLVSLAYSEMSEMADAGTDCWLSKVRKIKSLLGFHNLSPQLKPNIVGKKISRFLNSKFEAFWLKEVNTKKVGQDGLDHNKLRVYNQLKGCFKREPYLDLVCNRNQRSFLTRLRVSSHQLHIETGRYTRPVSTPIKDRICRYCSDEKIDDEAHFVLSCDTFKLKRQCFINKLALLAPNFLGLSDKEKLAVILCPISAKAAKLSNKFFKIMFSARKKIDDGYPVP